MVSEAAHRTKQEINDSDPYVYIHNCQSFTILGDFFLILFCTYIDYIYTVYRIKEYKACR